METEKTILAQGEQEPYIQPRSGDVAYFGAFQVVGAELESIGRRRRRRGIGDDTVPESKDLRGLALSGGGIRSASFSLGVMQALAHNRWLEKIDYLSTVSGGGYIGTSLTWTLNSDPDTFGLTRDTFPYASFPMSSESRDEERTSVQEVLESRNEKTRWSGRLLNFLRQNASYLTPGRGHNLFALVWIALRGAALGLLVYGAMIALLFLVTLKLHFFNEVCMPLLPKALRLNWVFLTAIAGLALCALSVPLYSLITYLYKWRFRTMAYRLRWWYEKGAGYVLPFLLALLLFGIIPKAHDWLYEKGVAPVKMTEQFTISGNLNAQGALTFSGTMHSTALPEKPAGSSPAPCASPCRESEPPAEDSLLAILSREVTAFWTGLGTILVGLLSGTMVFFKTKSDKPGRVPMGLLVSLGVAALLFGVVLFAYTVAHAVVTATCGTTLPLLFIGGGLAATLFLAVLTDLNHISIHRYYRDRLMETFMPNVDAVLGGRYKCATLSDRANSERLQAMADGPYHIINTNVVLASSDNPKFRVRGGDNFILSPCYCGSYATGWQSTKEFMQGGMTLASAMAISGAALNPSAGCGGEGITRSPVLSVLMGLLNFRLGYWVPNPKRRDDRFRPLNPNFILPGLWEVLLRYRLTENGKFLQLSDGGHFENLALYELVRRKLKLIIVCDGGADPKYTFSDLANAMEKVRTDFGALIMINDKDLRKVIPKASEDKGGIACAEQGYLVAPIKYADGSKGTLIYLTTTFFERLSGDLYGYKKEHPAFPDQSTGDQFFDEKQFEAYRELGFQTAWRMMLENEALIQV